MRKWMLCVLLVFCTLLAGCTGEKKDEEQALYDALFDPESHISVTVDMPESELRKMQEDYTRYEAMSSKSPIYRMADVTFAITTGSGETSTLTLEQVGVRMKGNNSRNDFYSDKDGIHSLLHLKLSFGETFDKKDYYGDDALEWESKEARSQRKERTFAGLEKLDLRWNRCDDGSYIKELYAMDAYRDAGVIAPRMNLASLDLGGTHMGVYAITEAIDETFLQRNLPESDWGGDLYKCAWASHGASLLSCDSVGIEDEDKAEFYSFDLKTNKKTSHHEAITNFITKLNGPMLPKEELEKILDTDQFLHFAAVSYLLGGMDDVRNNYNNYYLYFPPSGKAIFIPCDCDRVLGVLKDWDPTGHGGTKDNPFAKIQTSNGQRQENPVFIYTVQQGGYYVREFAAVLEELATHAWLEPETFAQRYETAKRLYADETNPGKKMRNAVGYGLRFDLDSTMHGNMPFADYITAKKATLTQALTRVEGYAKGEPALLANYYVRASFNNWEMRESFAMEPQPDGTYAISVYDGGNISFKVYYRNESRWIGASSLAPDSSFAASDSHESITLPGGSYRISYDPASDEIRVIPE